MCLHLGGATRKDNFIEAQFCSQYETVILLASELAAASCRSPKSLHLDLICVEMFAVRERHHMEDLSGFIAAMSAQFGGAIKLAPLETNICTLLRASCCGFDWRLSDCGRGCGDASFFTAPAR